MALLGGGRPERRVETLQVRQLLPGLLEALACFRKIEIPRSKPDILANAGKLAGFEQRLEEPVGRIPETSLDQVPAAGRLLPVFASDRLPSGHIRDESDRR